MREMAFILRNIEPRSMVIIDELGRGTSTVDGLAIAIAIAEALVDTHALVWFVTHFHDLARIMSQRNGVVNLHLAVDFSESASKMAMLYRISDGYAQDKHYGLALARLLPFPPRMLDVAEEVSHALSSKIEDQVRHTRTIAVTKRRQLLLALKEQLLQARDGALRGEELRRWLKQLQDEFTLQMVTIDAEVARVADEEGDGMLEVPMDVDGRRGSSEQTPMVVDDDYGADEGDVDEFTNITSPLPPA
jgi:DNA mismatch repair protein MSH4